MNTIYIYALVDPRTKEIRYVGQSIHPGRRLHDHVKESIDGILSYKCNWIRNILESGTYPELKILDSTSEKYSNIAEIIWIRYEKSKGCKLTNATNGGNGIIGYTLTELDKEKLRIASRKRWNNSENRKNFILSFRNKVISEKEREIISKRTTEMWKNPKYREKISNSLKEAWKRRRTGEYKKYERIENSKLRLHIKLILSHCKYKRKLSEEQVINKSKQARKQFSDPSQIEKLRIASRKRWDNPEQRKHISEKAKERWSNPEFRKKMKEIFNSTETRLKRSNSQKKTRKGKNNPFFGRHHSEESRNKMSESIKSYFHKKKSSED